jgi:hypothetical protein
MAFQQYQLAANMTEDSIRSIHFVQLPLAVERNYMLQSWHDWVLHLEGYSFTNCTDHRTARFSKPLYSMYKPIIWEKPTAWHTWTRCPTK